LDTYTVQQVDLTNRNQVKVFLRLPETIYKHNPFWVPPLRSDAARMLDPRRNPFFKRSSAAFFLAFDRYMQPVARVACLNHTPYNTFNREQTAFFYLFESMDQPGVALPLFNAAISYAREQGLNKIIGPKGFSTLDGIGLLTEGFDHLPALGIPYNPPYYARMIEDAGFQMTEEIVSGFMKRGAYIDPKIEIVAQRVEERRGLSIAHFQSKKDLKKLLPDLENLYNDAIQGTTGNYPITAEEASTMANQILWFSDPKLIKIIMKGARPVGFLFAYPDISKAMQRSKGRLFPLGWYFLLKELRTTRLMDINGAGIIDEFRGSGGTAILFNEIVKSTLNSRYSRVEIVQVSAKNERMLQELSNIGIIFHKKHSLYSRLIE
jgi:hypothetical protein